MSLPGASEKTQPTRFTGIRVQEALLGTPLVILIGQQRVAWKMIWYGDFISWPEGGSGMIKGGSEYAYAACIIGAICMGPCSNFLSIWATGSGRYMLDGTSETYAIPSSPANPVYVPIQSAYLVEDMGVGIAYDYSIDANDYGSPGVVTKSGTQQVPLKYTSSTPGPGQYSTTSGPFAAYSSITAYVTGDLVTYEGVNYQAKTDSTGETPPNATYWSVFTSAYVFNSADSANGTGVATISYVVFYANFSQTELDVIPFTPNVGIYYMITVENANQFAFPTLAGVSYYPSGVAMQQVEPNVVNTSPFSITSVANAFGGATVYTGTIPGGENNGWAGTNFAPSGFAQPSNNASNGPNGFFFECVASTGTTITLANLTGVADSSGTIALAGNFSSNGGNFIFNPADAGQGLSITYYYIDQSLASGAGNHGVPNREGYTLFAGELGQAPWTFSQNLYSGGQASPPPPQIGYSEVSYLAAAALYLGLSPNTPQLNFEIVGPFAFGNGIGDACPADAIYGLLTIPQYKYYFPAANIDYSLLGLCTITGAVTSGSFIDGEQVVQTGTGANAPLIQIQPVSNSMKTGPIAGNVPANATSTWVGQTSGAVYIPTAAPVDSSAKAQWVANNFFISQVLDAQTSLMDVFSDWCEAGQAYVSWDEGKLKFIPLVDTTTIGNGVTYSPPTQPVIDLDDDDFLIKPNEDPITIEQEPSQSRWNKVAVRWTVRTNSYNEDVLQIQDEASVQQYGLLTETPKSYQFLCTEDAAQFAANMRLQRYSAIYTTYKFTLKSNLAFLSPGDIVTVTDGLLNTPGTMFGRTPVRITKMSDDPVKGIGIEAESFPWSVGTALLYNKQAQLPSNTGDGPSANPGDTNAVIIEIPNQAAQYNGDRLAIFGNSPNTNWGGFQLYVSYDGVDYRWVGQYNVAGSIGALLDDYPSHADPDTTDTLTVTMQQSGATLLSISESAWNAGSPPGSGAPTLAALITPEVDSPVEETAGAGANIGSGGSGGPPGSEGPLSPTATVNAPASPSGGIPVAGTPWTISGTSASVTLEPASTGPTNISDGLAYTEFGFAVPPTGIAPILGLQVSFTTYASVSTSNVAPSLIVMLYYKGAVFGLPQTIYGSADYPTSPTVTTVGNLTDLSFWGLLPGALTAEIVNDPSFGVVITGQCTGEIGAGSTVIHISAPTLETAWSAGGAAVAWTNPGNAISSSAFATASLVGSQQTQWLFCYNFRFQIPFGCTIDSISVSFKAKTNSSAAQIAASLVSGQLYIGQPNAVLIGPTLAPYVMGGSLWGSGDQVWNVDTINEQGLYGFGIVFQGTGSIGDTISLNDVQVTVYVSGAYQLELVAYEDAELVGPNTYALTNIHRGLLGSYPCDHPSGAQFAQLNQDTLNFEVPAQYIGSTIYFKFLSFNAYGNMLQTLASVAAVAVPIQGISPGAIDARTGALISGIGIVTDPATGLPAVKYPHAAVTKALDVLNGPFGIQNIPSTFGLFGPPDQVSGEPVWQDVTTGAGGGVNDYHIYIPPVAGTYGTSQELYYEEVVRIVTMPVGLAGSQAGCRVAPTANLQVQLLHNGTVVGTVNFTAGSTVPTITFTNAITFYTSETIGGADSFQVLAPATVDKSFAGFWMVILASRLS